MTTRMRWAAAAALAVMIVAGCGTTEENPENPPPRPPVPIPKGLGRLIIDARRDGDKKALGYGFVLIPADLKPTDPDYKMYSEPNIGTINYNTRPPSLPEGWPPTFYLKPGRYKLDLYGNGACFRGDNIVVKQDEQVIYRANMEPGGSVEGVVLGPSSGQPLGGVVVWRPLDRGYGNDSKDWDPKNSYEASRICKTTEEGHFYIPNLPPGENTLVLYVPEVGWMERRVQIFDGKTMSLDPFRFEMTTKTPPK